MAFITEENFRNGLKQKNIPPCLFIFGEDSYMIDYYSEKVALIHKKDGNTGFLKIDGEDFNLSEIREFVLSFGLFGGSKFLHIKNFSPEMLKEKEKKEFFELLENAPEGTFFLLSDVAKEQKDKRKYPAAVTAFAEKYTALFLPARTKSEAVRFISGYIKKEGLAIEPSAAQYLADAKINHFLPIIGELNKLVCYKKEGTISLFDVKNLTTENVEAKIFELSKEIMRKNRENALILLNNLKLNRHEAVAIIAVMANCFSDLLKAFAAKKEGLSSDAAALLFKKNKFSFSYLYKDATGVNFKFAKKALTLLLEADTILKSRKNEPYVLLEETVVRLIRAVERAKS